MSYRCYAWTQAQTRYQREALLQLEAKDKDPDRFERAVQLAQTTLLSFWEAWERVGPSITPDAERLGHGGQK